MDKNKDKAKPIMDSKDKKKDCRLEKLKVVLPNVQKLNWDNLKLSSLVNPYTVDLLEKFFTSIDSKANDDDKERVDELAPILLKIIINTDDFSIQIEAVKALGVISTSHADILVSYDAISVLTKLLSSKSEDVREQVIWTLGNIADESGSFRNLVLASGALAPLLQEMSNSTKLSVLRNATWALSNFCKGKPPPDFTQVKAALPILADIIKYQNDPEVLVDACWALRYLSDGKNDRIESVVESGVVPSLVELLMHREQSVQTPALRTIGNIATGNDIQTQIVLNCGVLPYLFHLLGSTKKTIVKETCWTISNITAGLPDQIEAVIKANIIPPLIELLKSAEFDIRKEAAWAISNAISGGSSQQIQYITRQGCILAMLRDREPKIITLGLEAIEVLIRMNLFVKYLVMPLLDVRHRFQAGDDVQELLERIYDSIENEIRITSAAIIHHSNLMMIKKVPFDLMRLIVEYLPDSLGYEEN